MGAVVLATGYDLTEHPTLARYGYGVYDNVIDALQFERLTSAAGPTVGKVVTRDGRVPETTVFLHCIASRDDDAHEYCSRICCMYGTKQAHLALEKTGGQVYQFYIDMRTAGKGYEEFYKRMQHEGIHYVRGKVAEVMSDPDGSGKLLVRGEDTLLGRYVEIPADLVVLLTAAVPAEGARELGKLFGVSVDKDGFFAEAHPKLRPVDTTTAGVFLAGCCQSPKDIPDTVAQASAAASKAIGLLSQGRDRHRPHRRRSGSRQVLRLRRVHPGLPLQRHRAGGGQGPGQRGPVQGLWHLRRRLPGQGHHGPSLHRRGVDSPDRRHL